MGEDRDDTVIVPPRTIGPPLGAVPGESARDPALDDTVIIARPPGPSRAAPIAEPPAVLAGSYAVRIGLNGESIALDAPCIVGRSPRAPRVVTGAAPRLVRVDSRRHEISATHLEIRQLGESVIATDLRSTNGSVVMIPGSTPRTLRQGESVVVSPGTLIDIGDDTILQILPRRRHDPGTTERQP